MNSMKAAANNLRAHLGVDSRGLSLLDALVREANQTRKELAGARDELKRSDESLSAMRSQLDERDALIGELREHIRDHQNAVRRCQNTIADQQRTIEELERVLDPPLAVSEQNKLSNRAKFKRLFKALRKMLPALPTPTFSPRDNKPYFFELGDLVSDYKDEQYTRLGMFVVVCCLMRWSVGFVMKEEQALSVDLDKEGGGEHGNFLRWVKDEWIRDEAWREEISRRSFGAFKPSCHPEGDSFR